MNIQGLQFVSENLNIPYGTIKKVELQKEIQLIINIIFLMKKNQINLFHIKEI